LKSNCKSKLLKPAQRHFADEWLIDHNGTRAYKAAYASIRSDTTAKAAASRLLTNVNVDAYIQARQAEIAAKYQVTQERTLKEESFIAFADIRRAFKDGVLLMPEKMPEELRRAISAYEIIRQADGSIKYKVRFWDKGRALERISKHLGLYEKENAQQNQVTIREVYSALFAVDPELARAVMRGLEQRVKARG